MFGLGERGGKGWDIGPRLGPWIGAFSGGCDVMVGCCEVREGCRVGDSEGASVCAEAGLAVAVPSGEVNGEIG